MKHFLSIMLAAVVVSGLCVLLAVGCGTANKASSDGSDTVSVQCDSIPETETPITETEPEVSDEYRGSLLTESGNLKVYANYGLRDQSLGDDVYAKDETYLVRYVNEVPSDTMILIGPYSRLLGEESFCRIVVGVDTVDIDIRKCFPKTKDIRFAGALPECRFSRLSRHYAINDSARTTDFLINIGMPENTPSTIRNFISKTIRDDVSFYFSDDSDESKPHIPMMRMENRSVEQMTRHYYRYFRKLYHDEFTEGYEPGDRIYGEWYSYQCYIYPVWCSPDSTLTTWKFYDYSYMGGAHGGYREYFLTFDNSTGRVLGSRDLLPGPEHAKAIKNLTRQLNVYHGAESEEEFCLRAELDSIHMPGVFVEKINGRVYPRPAITPQGIVFSYQTYEKGGNPDGVLHFTQPYTCNLEIKR